MKHPDWADARFHDSASAEEGAYSEPFIHSHSIQFPPIEPAVSRSDKVKGLILAVVMGLAFAATLFLGWSA